jgi:methylthioribose-1-phosphate isomerase
MKVNGIPYRTVGLNGRQLSLINQPLLPHRFEIVITESHQETAQAIATMIVRGAGAIGAAGAAGMAQAALEAPENDFDDYIVKARECLQNTRPTAQNLFYGIGRVFDAIQHESVLDLKRQAAVAAAIAVADEDSDCCEQIGRHGSTLIQDGMQISTHCNAGWLAFVDWGSALSPIYAAHRQGRHVHVWVDETRPRSQGARLTAWELQQEGVNCSIIADNAIGSLMRSGQVDMVITGADRIAANGDVANKIGTYNLAVLAKQHAVPFYVAAPTTTIDHQCPSGAGFPIEERSGDEVAYTWGWSDQGVFTRVRTSPQGVTLRNPAFDITPASFLTGLITETGIVKPNTSTIETLGQAKSSD